MKVDEIKAMTTDEIDAKIVELKKEYLHLRFQHESGQLENTSILSKIRKDIARISTVAGEMNIN